MAASGDDCDTGNCAGDVRCREDTEELWREVLLVVSLLLPKCDSGSSLPQVDEDTLPANPPLPVLLLVHLLLDDVESLISSLLVLFTVVVLVEFARLVLLLQFLLFLPLLLLLLVLLRMLVLLLLLLLLILLSLLWR